MLYRYCGFTDICLIVGSRILVDRKLQLLEGWSVSGFKGGYKGVTGWCCSKGCVAVRRRFYRYSLNAFESP